MLTVTLQQEYFERRELIDFFLLCEIIKSHVMHLNIYEIQVAFPPKPRDSMFDITAVCLLIFTVPSSGCFFGRQDHAQRTRKYYFY